MHQLKAYWQIEIRDAKGRLLRRRRRLARSFVFQYVALLHNALSENDGDPNGITDTGGTARILTTTGAAIRLRLLGGLGATDGLVVGTGSTAVSINDTALGTKIADGSSAGQLSHQAQTYTDPSVSGATGSFTTTRVFINNSGGSITINEVGAYAAHLDGSAALRYFLIWRDLVSGGLAVPNGGSATLVYTISVTA